MASPVKLKAPVLLTVVEAEDAPLRVTVAPLPVPAGVMVPEMEKVGAALAAVKAGTVALPLLTVTDCTLGLKLNPELLGVTV